MSTVVQAPDSSPEVAEDWDNDDKATEEARTKQLEDRLRQVQIQQKEKEEKEARERLRAAEAKNVVNAQNLNSNVGPLKMQILRRPKSGDQLKDEEGKLQQEEEARSRVRKQTLEQRQAAYDEARNRILGSDYKPETNVPAPTVPTVSRNKSPEQIRVPRQPEAVPLFVPNMMNPDDPSRHQQMGFVQFNGPPPPPMQGNQQYVPFFDTSRPPPMMNMNYQHVPIAQYGPTGQYYAPMPTAIPQPQAMQLPYGRPPIAIYPPGSLGASMQFNIDSGQSQAQRKNRKGKKGKPNQVNSETSS
ncbi:unnamed protein product [Auanema sp. JU1783]|nr:unnamed protein product [Auanema sp. JU1783]